MGHSSLNLLMVVFRGTPFSIPVSFIMVIIIVTPQPHNTSIIMANDLSWVFLSPFPRYVLFTFAIVLPHGNMSNDRTTRQISKQHATLFIIASIFKTLLYHAYYNTNYYVNYYVNYKCIPKSYVAWPRLYLDMYVGIFRWLSLVWVSDQSY